MSRRLLPVAIAVLVLAVASAAFWWLTRPGPIPTKPPSTAPAVGTCWNVAAEAAGGVLPWPGPEVDCTAPHTVEVFYIGQVDRSLVETQRSAKGQDRQINTFLMTAEARAGCTAHADAFLGGSPRGAQVSVLPDFIRPAGDGFYVCALAQAADPANTRIVARTASLRGSLTPAGTSPLAIDCVSGNGTTLAYASCAESHTSEYVGLYTVTPPGAPYDGDQLKAAVTSGCGALMNGFLGLPATAARADLSSAFVGPSTSTSWVGSDQTFACYALAARPMHGSIKGLGTRALPH